MLSNTYDAVSKEHVKCIYVTGNLQNTAFLFISSEEETLWMSTRIPSKHNNKYVDITGLAKLSVIHVPK